MTHAHRIGEDGLHLELHQLWMLPIIFFQMICSFFQNEQTFIEDCRRKGSAPRDWEDHILDLVIAEWNIEAIKAEGVRRLLAGEDISFSTIRVPAPPDDWQPLVEDAADLMRRFEAVAAFHADPETFIRRHAARMSDDTHRSIVHTPSWFDGRLRDCVEQAAHHEGYNQHRTSSPHGGEARSAERTKRASVEPRGRRAPAALHVHTHPP